MAASLVYYGREDCPLCDELLAGLLPWARDRGIAVDLRDVDADPDSQRRYGHKVPVVLVDGLVAVSGHLDLVELDRLLRGGGPSR
jgi:predicted thioredoxin/glutaredoxin